MKIPNSQQHHSYQYTPAQVGKIQATQTSVRNGTWDKIEAVSHLFTAGKQTVEELRSLFDTGANNATDAKAATQSVVRDKTPQMPAADTFAFSDPARLDLMQLVRQEASQDLAHALPQMDAYMQSKQPTSDSPQTKQAVSDSLLAQDYVVLRREIEALTQQQKQLTQQQHFQQAIQHFVETAALIHTPHALDSYIQSNINAAEEELKQQDTYANSWPAQRKALYQQAVQHNIEVSLQTGDVKQAQTTWQYFSDKLSAEQNQFLREKIQFYHVQEVVQEAWPYVKEHCFGSQGKLEKAKWQTWCQTHIQDEKLKAPLQKAFEQQWHIQQRQDYQNQAAFYARCLQTPNTDLFAQTATWHFTTQQNALLQQVCRQYQQGNDIPSQKALYNQYYQQIVSGEISEKSLDESFANRQLSAEDTLRLKQAFCAKQAGQADRRESLLMPILEQLGTRANLSAETMQEVKYYVYTAGTTLDEKLQAAQQVKKLFNLQENHK